MDSVDGMVGDALQDVAQIEFGVEIVEFGRTEQAVQWPRRVRRRHLIGKR